MTRHSPLFIALPAGLLLATIAAAPARAQDGGTAGSLAATDFFIAVQRELGSNLRDFEVKRFFNKARCDCDVPVFLYFALQSSGLAKRATTPTGTVEFWIGSDCQNVVDRANRCIQIQETASQQISTFLNLGRQTIPATARQLSTDLSDRPADGGAPGACAPTRFTQTLWLILDYGSNGTPDMWATSAVDIDTIAPPPPPPPPPPTMPVEGGNRALNVSWTALNTVLVDDLLGYQVLCKRGADLQVFDPTAETSGCGTGADFTPGFQTCAATMQGTGPEALNPAFACSPVLSRTTTSYRVEILENGVTYGATVVAVDNSGNASAPDVFYGIPVKTKSFYDVYKEPTQQGGTEQPGTDDGGFCAVGRSSARVTLPGLAALAGLAVALVIRRRRRR